MGKVTPGGVRDACFFVHFPLLGWPKIYLRPDQRMDLSRQCDTVDLCAPFFRHHIYYATWRIVAVQEKQIRPRSSALRAGKIASKLAHTEIVTHLKIRSPARIIYAGIGHKSAKRSMDFMVSVISDAVICLRLKGFSD